MTRAEEFEELRPLLFSIAYRLLGSVAEAEDAVQETWLRWQASETTPASSNWWASSPSPANASAPSGPATTCTTWRAEPP